MSLLKKLASDTAAYGLSSILARLINYVFSFLIVKVVSPAEYGDYTKFYAFAGFILVLLTHGMETAYFRFRSKEGHNPKAFATGYLSMLVATAVFVLFCYVFQEPIAHYVKVADHPEYVIWFAWILALDTMVALPFASLRADNKAIKFAVYRVINILVFILLIVLFLFLMPHWKMNASTEMHWLLKWYDPETGIGYVFISNFMANVVTFLMLAPQLKRLRFDFDPALYKQMLPYAMPIMLVGFAGMVNEMLSRVMMEYLLPFDAQTNKEQLGIFGFNYKFAMLITLFLQAYRYAAEPYFFAQAGASNAKQVYAKSMHYFVIAGSFIFLLVMLTLPVIQHVLLLFDPKYGLYFTGDHVIPVLLGANLTLGIYFNLTTWYKVTDKTYIGAIISIMGATLTFLLNWWLVPKYGFTGAAWATLICYLSMVMAGFIAERKYYPIPYTYLATGSYIVLAIVMWQAFVWIRANKEPDMWTSIIISGLFLGIFLLVSYLREYSRVRAQNK